MDIRKELPGGEIGISSNEINLMPNSNRGGIHAINDGLGEGVDYIISGVNAVISAGVNVTLQDGYVFLNGETLKVDAQVVPRTVSTDLYQFLKVTTNPSAGIRNFRDSTTQNVYEENRAIAVNVASITDLAVNGDTMQDVLKTAIQVQTDWDQADNSQPDYLKNKPAILNVLLQGGVNGIDVGGAGFGSIFGGVTGVSVVENFGSDYRIRVNFNSLGTSNYHPLITLQSNLVDWNADNDVFCMVKSLTPTSFDVLFRELSSGVVQDLTLMISVIPF
jgi:hypothetical protein